jgi:hypothetical protein
MGPTGAIKKHPPPSLGRVDPRALAEALRLPEREDWLRVVLAVANAFACKGNTTDWRQRAEGLDAREIAVILAWRIQRREPLEWSSGFAQARGEWEDLPIGERRAIAAQALEPYGIDLTGHLRAPAEIQATIAEIAQQLGRDCTPLVEEAR